MIDRDRQAYFAECLLPGGDRGFLRMAVTMTRTGSGQLLPDLVPASTTGCCCGHAHDLLPVGEDAARELMAEEVDVPVTGEQPVDPVSRPTRWASCSTAWDRRAHLLLPEGEHPPGVLKARCGELLLTSATRFEQPPLQRCPTCDSIYRADSSEELPGVHGPVD